MLVDYGHRIGSRAHPDSTAGMELGGYGCADVAGHCVIRGSTTSYMSANEVLSHSGPPASGHATLGRRSELGCGTVGPAEDVREGVARCRSEQSRRTPPAPSAPTSNRARSVGSENAFVARGGRRPTLHQHAHAETFVIRRGWANWRSLIALDRSQSSSHRRRGHLPYQSRTRPSTEGNKRRRTSGTRMPRTRARANRSRPRRLLNPRFITEWPE